MSCGVLIINWISVNYRSMKKPIQSVVGIHSINGDLDILRLLLCDQYGVKSEIYIDAQSAPLLVMGAVHHSRPFHSYKERGILPEALKPIWDSNSSENKFFNAAS